MIQEDALHTLPRTHGALIPAVAVGGTLAPELYSRFKPASRRESRIDLATHKFLGRLEVFGLASGMTEQEFIVSETQTGVIVENRGSYPWPSIKIEFLVDETNKGIAIKEFHVNPADNTVDAEILFTRVLLALVAKKGCRLWDVSEGDFIEIRVNAEDDGTLFHRAKLSRNLKYIENFFGVRFNVPAALTVKNARHTEMIFRGITEGVFTMRQSTFTAYGYSPSAEDLNEPPFTEPGSITLTLTNGVDVFDQVLDVGPVKVRLERAAVSNRRILRNFRTDQPHHADIRFVVFDHRITYDFVRYSERSREELQQRLERFRRELLLQEPQGLVALMDEPLDPDVSSEEAKQIAVGWLQFCNFPDRFWPQTPYLAAGKWVVPVWVSYLGGKGDLVENLYVDVKTGILTVPTSAEEIMQNGKSVAEHLLSAR